MFGTLSFEGVSPGIRRVTPDDMPRGTVSRGGDDSVLSVLAASDPLLDFGEKGGRKVI